MSDALNRLKELSGRPGDEPAKPAPTATPVAQEVPDMRPDDISDIYASRRQNNAGTAAVSRLATMAGRDDKAAPPTEESPTSVEEIGKQEIKLEDDEPSFIDKAGNVVKDITTGAIETPRAAFRGVRNAAQETINLVSDLADSINTVLPSAGLAYDDKDGLRVLTGDEWNAFKKERGNIVDLPNVAPPTSMTGTIVEKGVQFAAGMAASGKILKSAKVLTGAGTITQAAAKGVLTDFAAFDPHEERLSNLVQSFPALANPITDFLASDPNDGAMEGRFKNALEGAGLGVAVDAVVQGVKTLKSSRFVREWLGKKVDPTLMELPAKEVKSSDFSVIGDVESNDLLYSRTKTRVDKASERMAGVNPEDVGGQVAETFDEVVKAADDQVEINFARIESPEDIQSVMQQMADLDKGAIDNAKRGKRSWAETQMSAEQEDAWSVLMARRKGDALNAEQTVAARNLWASSTSKLTEAAQIASAAPTDANMFNFRKMLATHGAIQSEVLAARTETARALNAWKIPTGSTKEMATKLEAMMSTYGGNEVGSELAKRVAALAQAGKITELDALVKGSTFTKTMDGVHQVWINSLLSGPQTHLVNAMSNTSVLVQSIVERKTAELIRQTLGGGETGTELGEALAMIGGAQASFKDALVASGKKFATNVSDFAGGKIEALPGALKAENFNISSETWVGRTLDALDEVTNVPGRALGAGDEFFKTIGYRMELHAQAQRLAAREVRDGALDARAMKERVADIIANPPESIRLESVSSATYRTFTNKPNQTLEKLASGVQGLTIGRLNVGRIIMPFKNTPINIFTYTMERTPLAPLMDTFKADVAAGGARADLALAKMGLGSMVMATTMDMAMSGVVTGAGPQDPGERANWMRQGNQPYSFKVGDKWYSYTRLDPVGSTMGMAADLMEIALNAGEELTDNEYGTVMAKSMLALTQSVMSKTYMSGVSQIIDAINNPQMRSDSWIKRMAGTVIPSGVATVARSQDPYMRAVDDSMDAIKARIPGLSKGLPPVRDMWGRKVKMVYGENAVVNALNPIYMKRENPEPIDTELDRLEFYPKNPSNRITYNGVGLELDGAQKSRLMELMGATPLVPKFQGLSLKEFLNETVQGRSSMSSVYQLYSDGPEGGKAELIKGWMLDAKKAAVNQLMQEDGALNSEFESKKRIGTSKIDPALMGL